MRIWFPDQPQANFVQHITVKTHRMIVQSIDNNEFWQYVMCPACRRITVKSKNEGDVYCACNRPAPLDSSEIIWCEVD